MNNNVAMQAMAAIPDVYTNLEGLQRLSNNPNKEEALREVAEQFESMFLSLLLKNMRQANAVFDEGSLFSTHESKIIRDMYDHQLALNMADGQGIGLAEIFYRQMSGQYGDHLSRENSTQDTITQESIAQESTAQESISTINQPSAGMTASQNTAARRATIAKNPADFVEQLLPYAQTAAEKLGADAELLLAQAALETGWGQFVLADAQGASSHNLFNIKAHAGWEGETLSVQALEYRNGTALRERSQFKQYANLAQSFNDYVTLLKDSPRYADALQQVGNAEDFMQSLQRAGYATDPHYADKVLSVYREIIGNHHG